MSGVVVAARADRVTARMQPTPPDRASRSTTGPDPINAAPHGPRARAEAGEHGLDVDTDPREVAEQEPDLDPELLRDDDAGEDHAEAPASGVHRDEDPIAAPAPPGSDPPRSEHAELGDQAYGVGADE